QRARSSSGTGTGRCRYVARMDSTSVLSSRTVRAGGGGGSCPAAEAAVTGEGGWRRGSETVHHISSRPRSYPRTAGLAARAVRTTLSARVRGRHPGSRAATHTSATIAAFATGWPGWHRLGRIEGPLRRLALVDPVDQRAQEAELVPGV